MKMSIRDLIDYAIEQPNSRSSVRIGSEPKHVYYRDDIEIDVSKVAHYVSTKALWDYKIKERAEGLARRQKNGDKLCGY